MGNATETVTPCQATATQLVEDLGAMLDATPEEAAFYLKLDLEHIERAGLTFAEPGDPDAFLVKWKGREWDRGRLESMEEAEESAQV